MFFFADRLFLDSWLHLWEWRWVPNAEAIETMLLAEERQSSSILETKAVSKGKDFEDGLMSLGRRWVRGGGVKEENHASGYAACREHSFGAQRHVHESACSGERCHQFLLRELQDQMVSSCDLEALLPAAGNPTVSVTKYQANGQLWGQLAMSWQEGEVLGGDSTKLGSDEQTILKYALGQVVAVEFEEAEVGFHIAPHMDVAMTEVQILLSQSEHFHRVGKCLQGPLTGLHHSQDWKPRKLTLTLLGYGGYRPVVVYVENYQRKVKRNWWASSKW